MNTRFLDALACRNSGRPPVWLMRQAGRYMPEYRAIRSKHSFLEMCRTPEIAAEVTQLPIKVFGFDAAILFSDILVIADALGVGLRFEEQVGPIIERPVRSRSDVEKLPPVDPNEKLPYVSQTIRLLKPALKVPLIGFCGAPFTVASYMVEGGSSRTLHQTKKWMLADPSGFHELLDKITAATISYLRMQADAGVDAIQIFDSWANFLAFPQFQEFSLAYMKKLIEGLKDKKVPVILFCKGASVFAPELAKLSPAGISIDWNGSLPAIRQSVKLPIALQGNLDPDILYAPAEGVKKETLRLINSMKGDPGYIFNLGHGILPDISPDAVKVLVETVRQG